MNLNQIEELRMRYLSLTQSQKEREYRERYKDSPYDEQYVEMMVEGVDVTEPLRTDSVWDNKLNNEVEL